MLTYHKTTEEEKERITAWQYTGEYAIYNTAPYAEQKARGVGFAIPKTSSIRFLKKTGLSASSISMRSQPRSSSESVSARTCAAEALAGR